MVHRALSLALAGVIILATAASAFAQVTVTTPFNTAGVSADGRVDILVGYSQSQTVPPVASGTFVPQVKAIDMTSAPMGTTIVPYVQDLNGYFANTFGWRPSKPVTVLLYSNASNLRGGLQSFTGGTISANQQNVALSEPAAFITVTNGDGLVPTNSWAILVNTDINAASQQYANLAGQVNAIDASLVPGASGGTAGTPSSPVISPSSFNTGVLSQDQIFNNGMAMIQESLARQYANVMMTDLGGNNVPGWFRQGLGDAIAFSVVPGTPVETGLSTAVARSLSNTGTLPTLTQINAGGYPALLTTGGTSGAIGEGVSYLASQSLINNTNGIQIANLLRGLGSGQSFETSLGSSTGFNLNTLNSQYQSLIPIL